MIVVRFKETFRERATEWALSVGLLVWGLFTLTAKDLFITSLFFHPLLRIMSQPAWGIFSVVVGVIRLIFLVINGAWRPSAHIRAVGAILGSLVWTALFTSSLSLGWLTPATAIYALLISLDLLSLWFSAGDAKLADLSAKNKLGV